MKLERVLRVTSSVLGELPLQEGGSTFRPAGVKRKTWAGDMPENAGFTEEPVCAELKLKLNATNATDEKGQTLNVQRFNNVMDDTLTIITNSGKEYMMSKAWITEPGELGDAEISVTYHSGTSALLKE